MEFALIRLQSDGKTAKAPIDREQTVIGRQTGCQLRIRSAEVSRKHAEIRFEESTASIKDLGSSNGTYVNGVKVIEKRLEAGDLIAIGPVVLLVQLGGEPASFDAASLYRDGVPGGAAPVAATAGTGSASAAAAAAAKPDGDVPTSSGLLDGIDGVSSDMDDSSVMEFDFDFDESDEDEQPPL